jgi:hypothetical protein
LLHLAESVSGTACEKAALPYRQLFPWLVLPSAIRRSACGGLTEDSEKGAALAKI